MCLSSVLKREISSKDDQQLRREEELASRHFVIDREGMVRRGAYLYAISHWSCAGVCYDKMAAFWVSS